MTTYVGNPPKSVYGVKDATNVIADFVTDGIQTSYEILNDFIANPELNVNVTSAVSTTPLISIVRSDDLVKTNYTTRYENRIGTGAPTSGIDAANSYFIDSNNGNILSTEATVFYKDDAVFGLFGWTSENFAWQGNFKRTVYEGYQTSGSHVTPLGFVLVDTISPSTPIPAGVHIIVTSVAATNLVLPLEYSAPRKNYIINPDFAINQRGVSDGLTASGIFRVDRFRIGGTTTTLTLDEATQTMTIGSEGGFFIQPVEKQNSLQNKTMTLSWEGTAQCQVTNGSVDLVSLGSSPQTFEVIDYAPETKAQLYLRWDAGTVRKPKLELGDTVTPFDFPDTATELSKCQRYYEIGAYASIMNGVTTTNHQMIASFKATKRAAPTVVVSGASSGTASGETIDTFIANGGTSNTLLGDFTADAEI